MELPCIRITESYGTASTLTKRYISGENDLDLKTIYTNVCTLLDHPGRAHLDERRKVIPCSNIFLDTFWSAAASLLDYFSDFYATDTAVMQSIWFHLLDTWQKANPISLFHSDIEYRYSRSAQTFEQDYKDTINLIHRLISSRSRAHSDHGKSIIHCPSGNAKGPGGWYETGAFISGLKPWHQFLYSGAPGFEPGLVGKKTLIAHCPRVHGDASTRYIPQPAIALIQAHTARARALAARVARNHDAHLPETLAAFDAHALAIPSTTTRSYTYPSFVHRGKLMCYQLVQGAPPVKRHEGLGDPSMMIDDPDLVLLDEAVGMCKGREAYVPMTGPVGQAGVGFDVWAVTESQHVLGWWGSSAQTDGKKVLMDGMGELFDEWQFEDDGF